MIKRNIKEALLSLLTGLLVFGQVTFGYSQTASLLPNAVQQFFDANGNPLSGGSVGTYIPNTLTLKTTWKDAAESITNTNPITLDGAGKAIIYGDGSYRQIVKDRLGNLIWDAVTNAPVPGGTTIVTGDGDQVGTVKPWAGIIAPSQYSFANGQELSRTTFSALFTAITQTLNVNCTSGSTILTGLTDTTQIPISAPVEGTCVNPGATVVSKTSSTITLSSLANATINTTATFFPYGNGNSSTTFNLPDLRGYVIAGRPNMGGTASTNLTSTYFGANPLAIGAKGGNQSTTLLLANLPPYTPSGSLGGSQSFSSVAQFLSGATAFNSGTGNQSNTLTVNGSNFTFTGTAQGGTSTPLSLIQPTITLNYIIKTTPDTSAQVASGVASLGGQVGAIGCSTGILCTGNNILIDSSVVALTANAALLAGNNTYTGDNLFGNGRPWCDVRAKGAKGDGSTDDTAAFQACVTTVEAFASSGTIYVPSSANQYCIKTGPVQLNAANTRIIGASRNVQVSSCGSGNSVLKLTNSQQEAQELFLVGPGGGDGATAFSATNSTLILGQNCIECYIAHLTVSGGLHAIQWNSGFAKAFDVSAFNSYGSAIIYFNAAAGHVAAGWLENILPDQTEYPVGVPAQGTTFAGRANLTAYTTGTVVGLQCQDGLFYYVQATNNGTTGAALPTCKNYGQNITDGSVIWNLSRPNPYYHYQLDTGTSEIFLLNSDTGGGDAGVAMTNTLAGTAPNSFRGVNLNGGSGYISNFWVQSGSDFQVVNVNTGGCILPNCGNYFFQTAFTDSAKITGGNCGGSPYCIIATSGSNFNVTGVIGASLTSGIASITGTVDNVYIDGVFTGTTTFSNTSSGTSIVVQNSQKPWTLLNGGTNNTLTASNGGILWSDASKLNILAGTANANRPLLSGNVATPSWAAISYPTSATSGGIPYFSSTSVMASSALLTQNAIMLGGGAGNPPVPLGSLGTTITLLHGNAAGAPTFGAVVSADLNITSTTCTNQFISAISSTGVGTCSSPTDAEIPLTNTHILVGNVSNIAVDVVLSGDATLTNTGVFTIANTAINYAKIQNLGALALMGRATNTSGVGADIQAIAASNAVLRESGNTIGFGTIATAGIANNAITLAKLDTQLTNTVLGNATSGTAVPTALAVGTCSTASSALIWTTNTGFGCNTSITASSVAVGGITGAGTGIITFLTTPTSVNLASAVTDETGSGSLVFGTSPTITGSTLTGITSLGIRDTSAAFDLTLAATSTSATLTAGRTLTLDVGNVAHTIKLGTIANNIIFPNTSASYNVLTDANTITLSQGGTSSNLTASNGGVFYSTASAGAILAGTATARQMFQSGASTTPAWSTTTWPATTTINRLLWSSATNVISDLATANSSVLITDSGGIPSFSTTLPNIAHGTPTSITLTNATGTANSLTAGNVTTNANLTGPITSVGNATSIASQTGTGTKFVVDTSPTLVTPILGTATGTRISLANGTSNGYFLQSPAGADDGKLVMGAGGNMFFQAPLNATCSTVCSIFINDSAGNGVFTMQHAGVFGGAAPTLATDFAGIAATKEATGSAYGSNAFNVAGGFGVVKKVFMTGLSASSAGLSAACVENTGEITVNTGVTTCLISSERWKTDIRNLVSSEFSSNVALLAMQPKLFKYTNISNDINIIGDQIGFIAEDMYNISPPLAAVGNDGLVRSWRVEPVVTLLVQGYQQHNQEIISLKAEIEKLKQKVAK